VEVGLQTLLETIGINNVLGIAINTMAGKWHLVADVAKTLAQTYGSTSSVCGVAFCGIQCTSWELFGNSLGTLRELLGTV
jgi:phenylpyruvate tautomerase PptA (4-oxalocrotonate tautomerase family)